MAALSGGDSIARALSAIGQKMSGSLTVGFMNGATYPDGVKVAQVAFWNEFGTATAPSRPFFRKMIADESPGWGALVARAAAYYNYNGATVLNFMGEKIAEDLQQSIVGWQDPRNAPSTIAKKGFDKPLVDTGDMSRSITYEVAP
jgi:hypothetical protein